MKANATPTTCEDEMVNSDSVNLGSNPSSPATQNVDISGKTAPGHSGHPGQTAHIGRTEVGTALLLALFEDHYWDTLTPHREIVLAHVRSVLGLVCPVMRADAPLLAAAPDLLAALRLAADNIREMDGGDQHSETGWKSDELLDVWLKCRDAIAKATGATP